jgi:hypothetical protein
MLHSGGVRLVDLGKKERSHIMLYLYLYKFNLHNQLYRTEHLPEILASILQKRSLVPFKNEVYKLISQK